MTTALSPSQHARIRLHLALIPAYLWLVYGWIDLLEHLPVRVPGSAAQPARDFIQFYVPGAIANRHDIAALYDIDQWAALVPRLVPGVTDARFPPIYGPQISLLFAPLARLPYGTAVMVWMVLTLTASLACGYWVWNACPRLRRYRAAAILLLVASPALHFAISFTQISALALLCVTGAFFALRANRPFLAGVAIGSLVYKPQLGIAAAVIFVAAAEWKVVLGAILGAILQLGAAAVFWGPAVLGDYAAALIRLTPQIPIQFEPYRFQMHSWLAFFSLLGVPDRPAMIAYVIVAAVILFIALRCWKSPAPLAVRYSVFLFATVLVDPHIYVYDLLVLIPALLLLWDWTIEQGSTGSRGLLYLCYWTPLMGAVALSTRIQVSVMILSVTGLVIVRAAASSPPQDHAARLASAV